MEKKTTKRISVWAALLLAFAMLFTAITFTAFGKTRAFADGGQNQLLYVVDCGRVTWQEAEKTDDQLEYGYNAVDKTLKYISATKTFVKREGGTFGDATDFEGKPLTRLLNSYTDKPFSMADPSGKNWGFNEDYTNDMPHRLGRGGDYSGGFSEFRSVNDDTVTTERLVYKFEVSDDEALDVTVITHSPDGWGTVNGKMSVNGGEAIDLVADDSNTDHSIPGCEGVLNSEDNKYYLTLTFGVDGAKTVVNGIIIRRMPNKYNVFYHLDGGANNNANTATYTNGTGLTLADPTRTGYTFDGWYDAAEGGNKVTTISATKTGSMNLYARWTAATYTITYSLDGGTNNDANAATYTYGVGLTLANPTRDGYTFDGWYSAETYGTKVTEISATQTGDLTLYARWTKETATGTDTDPAKDPSKEPTTDTSTDGGCKSSIGGTAALLVGAMLIPAGAVALKRKKK